MESSIAKRLQDPQQRAPLPELTPLKSHNGFKNVWDLFFKDYSYLNKLAIPPILAGSALNDIISGNMEVWERPHLCLVCPGNPDPVLLKHCLQPHKLHTHGDMIMYDYAFNAHNITLNVACAFSGNVANSLMTRWPEKLSRCGRQGRRSSYLVYGESQLREAEVHGFGKNLQADESVSRVCSLQFHRGGILLSKGPYFFEHDPSGPGYRYDSKYSMLCEQYYYEKSKRFYNPLLEKYRCEACSLKGDAIFDW